VSAPSIERASPRPLPMTALAVSAALAGVGVLTFFLGLASDAATAWRAFHVNYLYFGGIAQGGIVIAAIFVIVGARWPGPVRRIAEGLAAWVPVTLLLGVVGIFGRRHVYPWIDEPLSWKAAWLNETRLFVTDLGILALLTVLTLLFLRTSLRPTLRTAADTSSGFAKTVLERWTAGWRGEEAEREAAERRLRVLAPIICLAYAFGFSMIGFDQVMSLSPTWFSNLFGAFFAWGAFLSAVSVTALLTVLHRRYPGFEGEITRDRLHDLGKMVFAFSIFWMYLFFSQYLVIWYGNLPEETEFIQARLGTQFLQSTWYFEGFWDRIWNEPWVRVTLFAWICIWVIPFWFLLGQRPKRTGWWLASVAAISALGFWTERNVLVWPSLVPEDTWAFLGWIQIGVALGFIGAFALTYLLFTRVLPSLPVPQRP
jgi:Ni/Fe-hydrogenase subunit HybB-like protein